MYKLCIKREREVLAELKAHRPSHPVSRTRETCIRRGGDKGKGRGAIGSLKGELWSQFICLRALA